MKRVIPVLVLFLALALLIAAGPTPVVSSASAPSSTLLITLAPPGAARTLPATRSLVDSRAFEQLSQFVPMLKSLQRRGLIAEFDLLFDANSIQVTGAQAEAQLLLREMQGVRDVSAATPERLQTARNEVRQAQGERVRQSTLTVNWPNLPNPAGPTVQVHETWDVVAGWHFNPGDGVSIALKDSGDSLKKTVASTVNGSGEFKVQFMDGTPNGDILSTDKVVITPDTGSPITVIGEEISIEFDYASNRIYGTAGPSRTIGVSARDPGTGWCSYAEYYQETTTDGSGNYSADLTGHVDISRMTEADVSSEVSPASQWVVWRHAPWTQVNPYPAQSNGWGYAPKLEDVTVKLLTGATVKQEITISPKSPDANFGFRFDQADILPGDTVEFSQGGTPWSTLLVTALTTNLNPVSNVISGSAPAGKSITVGGNRYNATNGDWEGACQTLTVGSGGTYTLNLGLDLKGGDQAHANLPDTEGNDLHVWDAAPYVEMVVGQNILSGRFHSNFDGEVKLTVKTAAGVVRYSGKAYAFGGWWRQVLARNGLPVNLQVGNKVTTTPVPLSGPALNATVANLSAALDLVNNRVTGLAPAKKYLNASALWWQGRNYTCDPCGVKLQADPTGHYAYTFTNHTLVAGDYAEVYFIDSLGNRTYARGLSTNPTLTFVSYPALMRLGRKNLVVANMAGGMHVDDMAIRWDAVTRPDWNYAAGNGPNYDWYPGGPGNYTFEFGFPSPGIMYFRGIAWVDGRIIYTPERVVPIR